MSKADRKTRKNEYFSRLLRLVEEYPKILIVGADNVRSKQLQQIRKSLRGQAEILMGKNTLIRRALRNVIAEKPELERLLPCVRGNVGFVFTKSDLSKVRDVLLANKVPAPARAGAISPCAVVIPACNTGMGPEKTSFFQALKITTKISRGTIEITNDVELLKPGDKVGASEAALLQMMNMSPFTYGLVVLKVFDDGFLFDPVVLDITEDDLLSKFRQGIMTVAAVSLGINYPTVASIPHSFINGYKNVLAVALATDISFSYADKVKEMLANPEMFAASAAAAAPSAVAAADNAVASKKVEQEEEEEEVDAGGLFGDDDY